MIQRSNRISLVIILLLFGGCALAFHARCLDNAILQAQTFKDNGYEVRIAYGKRPDGTMHVQAQAKIKGKWKWLKDSTIAETGVKHNFVVRENLSLEETKKRWKH